MRSATTGPVRPTAASTSGVRPGCSVTFTRWSPATWSCTTTSVSGSTTTGAWS
ncbi:hypothetical protein [Kitasatospora sp. NBC_01266]|uniref:hypothetical protein n=1 Tax=Kitasatospora sp. NBC_01266 TaxID=2903572 RepID=UPI002E316932|nr:hypothetical protein [Kitasatospora sp. NBC_01266]